MPLENAFVQILDQRVDALLRLGLEVTLDIHLADEIADRAFDGVDAALPARLQLLDAGDGALAELELALHELRRQVRRVGVQQLVAEVDAPVGDRHLGEDLVERFEVARLRDVHRRDFLARNLRAAQERIPIERRHQLRERRAIVTVVGLLGVAVLHARPVRGGDARLDCVDLLGRAGCVGRLGERQQVAHVRLVLLANAFQLGVVREVIVAIRHAEAGLRHGAEVLGGVLLVDGDEVRERLRDEQALRAADVARDILLRFQRVDARELVLQRLQPARFDRGLVEKARVVVADFLRIAAGRSLGVHGCFEDVAQVALRVFLQLGERAVVGTVGRDLRRRQPAAVDVPIEVVLRPDRLVQVLQVHARLQDARGRGRVRRVGDERRAGEHAGQQFDVHGRSLAHSRIDSLRVARRAGAAATPPSGCPSPTAERFQHVRPAAGRRRTLWYTAAWRTMCRRSR